MAAAEPVPAGRGRPLLGQPIGGGQPGDAHCFAGFISPQEGAAAHVLPCRRCLPISAGFRQSSVKRKVYELPITLAVTADICGVGRSILTFAGSFTRCCIATPPRAGLQAELPEGE